MGPCPLVAGVSHVSVSLNVSLSVCPPPATPGTQPAQGGCSESADREREPHSHPSVGASVQEEAGLHWLEPVTFPSTSYAVGCALSTSRWFQGVGRGLGR